MRSIGLRKRGDCSRRTRNILGVMRELELDRLNVTHMPLVAGPTLGPLSGRSGRAPADKTSCPGRG